MASYIEAQRRPSLILSVLHYGSVEETIKARERERERERERRRLAD